MIMEGHPWEQKLLHRIMKIVKRGLKRQEELLFQKLEKYEKSFQEKRDKVMEAIQVVKENVAVEDPLFENSSEEQDASDETSNKKDKYTEMKQEQDLISYTSNTREDYEEEKHVNGDDMILEFAMGNAKAKNEILAIEIHGNIFDNKKDGVTKSVGTVSKWQNSTNQDCECSCCNPVSLIEDEWEISRRERKKAQPSKYCDFEGTSMRNLDKKKEKKIHFHILILSSRLFSATKVYVHFLDMEAIVFQSK
ncbi:uncharacterized protein LOC131179907 isoform X2 [Hevea brasiliensis]|nr:uncharacterized protein LOC131179907 isoform X2 [Hevea brasiliensis]